MNTQTVSEERLMDVRDVAAKLGLSEQQVYRLKKLGHIPFVMVGAQIRFIPSDIENWLRSGESANAMNERHAKAAN